MSKIFHEDMEQIVSDSNIPWDEMKGSTTLVTGATGLIGSAIVRALSEANRRHGLGIRVLAFGRDREKAKKLFESSCIEFFQHDILNQLKVDCPVDYIFHCAAVTKSSEMASNPVGVVEISLRGTSNILDLAGKKHIKSMVYLSSMEIYGDTDPALPYVTEDILGSIDLKSPRSSYPESKRMCESLCYCHFAQFGTPVKTARLAQTFGAGTPSDDPRVFAQFARSSVLGEDIVLHTDGNSYSNFCYISDTVRGLFIVLLRGKNAEAYNISNPDVSMTIRRMAELVAREVSGGKISVVVDKPSDLSKYGYAPDVNRRLSIEKIEMLGWRPKYSLAEMYRRMIADWLESDKQFKEQSIGGKTSA